MLDKKLMNDNKPVVGGRASICNWDLQFSFRTREQCKKFIDRLFELDMHMVPEFDYTEDHNDGTNSQMFHVSIHSMPWAHNLVTIAKILEEVDYQDAI